MAKNKAEWENKSRFKYARSAIAIGVVLVVAAALILTGVLLTVVDGGGGAPSVSAINLESEKIGMTADLDNVFVKIVYSDGSSRSVSLSELMPEGLDLSYAGLQNVTINYGNQQWSIPIEVVSSKIKIEYFTGDGGYIEGDSYQEVAAGESGATVRAVANEGYHFLSWDDGVLSETRSERSVSQNKTIRALFERNSYTVAFQRADGRWDEQTVLYGDPAVPPASDTWKMRNYGYKFLRWDESVAGELSSVTRDLLVRGEYEQYHSNFRIAVTGNPDNVKDRTVSAANHTYGSDAQTENKNGSVSYVLDGQSYTRRANLYSGFYEWQASPASVIAVNAAQDSVLDCWLVKMQNGQWQKIEVGGSATVLLPGGGGDSSDMVEFSAANADNGVYKLTFTLQPLVNKDAVLEVVAVMEYRTNDIMFYNRADHVKTVALPYDETLEASDFPVLEMTGYDFDGWYIRNTDIEVTTENYFKEATIVDARWTPKRYNVEFTVPQECIDNGFAPRTVVKEYLSTIGRDFPPTSPRRDGYDFAGWFVAGASGGAAVTEATVVYGNMTLEPRFTPKRHVIKFEVSGGSARITVVKDGGAAEAVGSGTFTIEEPSSYVFTVEWNGEYVLSSLAVDGNGVSPVVSDNSFTLDFNKGGAGGAYTTESEHAVNIALADKEYELFFLNGAAGINGTVTVSGDYGATSDDAEISVSVPMHAQVLYTVVAPKGFVIETLKVDGTDVGISPNTAEYTGLLGDFNADCEIEISYAQRVHGITVRDGENETNYNVISENSFEYTITAPQNKYAKSVTINGRAVDLYRFSAPSADAYYIDGNGFTVNMRGASSSEIAERDARVTGATFKIDSVSEDFALIVEYADLEYTLKFDSVGYGRVLSEQSVSVKRGDGWAAVLSTDTGYYVAGYRVSVYNPSIGTTETKTVNYNSFSTNYTEEITNVTEDAEYTFIFARREFGIIFAASGGSVSIEKDGETTVLSGSALAEYSVSYGGSARFDISVAADKIIDRVYLISDGGTTEELETGEVESSYTLVLDKVKDGMRVVVFVSEKPEISGDGAIVVEKTVGGKIASASGGRYTAGQAAEFTVIPESGYEIRSVVVSSAGKFSRAITAAGIVNGKFSVSAEDTALASGADIRVSPVFSPKNYDIELKIEEANVGSRLEGQGKIAVGPEKDSAADKIDAVGSFTEKAAYGSNYYIYFIAADNCIISQIRIDGVPVELDSSNLEDYTVAAGGYSVARIAVKVAGDTVVSVSFIKETFNATVATSYNGTTEIVNAEGGFLKGENVLIGMTADTGYHITALYIDGIKVDESLYLDFSGDDAKLNTSAKYTYMSITRNITVAAQYEMNYYTLGFTAVNVSDNFAAVNTAFNSYGSISAEYSNGGTPVIVSEVDGQAEYNATYGGIAHGSTATLNIRAAYESGYYIKNLTVRMLSGGTAYELIKDGAMGVYDENAPCYATAAGIRDGIVYGAAVGVRGDGGISADVYSVYVEFARTKFKVRTYFGEGADSAAVGISFVNSYNNGQAAFYETNVDASGTYYTVEFGIQATVSVNPLEKYRLSSLAGADGTDYTYNVIGNRYTGLIARDVTFIATYEVRQMNITLTVGGEDYGSANIDGFSGGTATVPYGSSVRFILIPEASRGGIIDGLRINGGGVTLVEENGVYYYVVGEVTSDIEAEAYFTVKKYSATQTVNVSAGGSVALTDENGNSLNNNEIAWGETLVATITVNRAYNLVTVTLNGSPYRIEDLEYEEQNGIRRYILTIADVRENYALSVNFALKTFAWEASFEEARGDTFIGDARGRKLDVLTANDDVYLYVKPYAGFMVSTVSARMQGFDGNYSAVTLEGERYDSVNLDLRRYKIDDVSGIIVATVSLAQKEFDLKIDSLIGFDGMERLSLTVRRSNVIMGSIDLGYWNSSVIRNVRFGDEITLIMKAATGYDMVGVSVNGMEYLAGRNIINYNVTSDEFGWTVTVNDELVNNRDENDDLVVGGDAAYKLDFTIAAERDSFTVVLSGVYEGIADVTVAASITFGSRNGITVTAHEGYSVTSVRIGHPIGYATGNYEWLTMFDERSPVAELEIVTDGSYGVFHYNDSTGVMTKRIFIEVNAEINSYNQQVSEYVHDNDPKTTDASETDKVASTLSAYYINKEGMQINLAYATSIEHFTEVTVETNHTLPREYEFWGFQELVSGEWTGEIANISYAGGSRNKFTYIVDRARNFRAVYVKKYTVEVEIVPFHKYLSGSYIPETGTFMNYATYGSIGAAVTDPFGLGTENAQNVSSTNANFVYEVCFGDALSVTAADSNTQNRSRSVNYYAENADGTLTLLSSGSMGMSLTVDKDMRIFAAFDNNLQFAFTTEETGGEQKGEGATVEFSVNGSNKYLQNNSVAVAAFDRVSVKITLADNYRFEGLYSLEAKNRGELGTLIWTSTWNTLFDFAAEGASGVVNDLDPNDKITHVQNGNVLTFEFVATENAIYKLVLHRMFTVNISETNGYDADGAAVTVAGGASIGGEVKNNAAPDGWFDYGATLVLDSVAVENSQFVGWFINGTNYFDLGASLMWRNDSYGNHEFTLAGDRVSGAKHLEIVAEYLPIFTLNIYRGLEFKNEKFYGSTSVTSVNAVEYRNSSISITQGTPTEAEELFDLSGGSLDILTNIVSFAEKDNLSKVSNTVSLIVRPNASFVFSDWSIKIGDGNWEKIEGSNDTEYEFDLVSYLYGKGLATDSDGVAAVPRDIHFRANIAKKNVVRVSKVVYYDAFGVISPSNGLADNRAYVGDGNTQTVSTVDYGTEVTVNVQAGRDYRFLGWYDITDGDTNNITEIGDMTLTAVSTDASYTLNLIKGAAEAPVEGYTYYLEARFMREVTVTFAVENNSANGNESFKYQVPVVRGTAPAEINYAGEVVTTADTSDINSATGSAASARHSVTLKKDAGTYVSYILPTDVTLDGYSPANHKYLGLSSGSYVERGTDGEYYVMFDRNRTITVLYGAYGTINLEDILPNATVTFGETFTNLYLDQNSGSPTIDTARYSVSVSGARLVVRNKTADSITVPLPNMPKIDYQTDKNSPAAASYEKVDVHILPMATNQVLSYDVAIGFSYSSEEKMTLDYSLVDFGQMPFARGAGTQDNPYIINGVEQFKNVGRVYTLSGNTFGATYRHFAMETLMRNGSLIPESQKFMYLNEDGEDWTPLCSEGNGFNGTFDFKDWEIGGLTGTASSDYFGVFARLSGATIKSFNFGGKNSVTGTANYVGFITGYATNTTFDDINVKDNRTRFLDGNTSVGTIGTTGNYLGLVAGYAENCTINSGIYIYAATVAGGGERDTVMGETVLRRGMYVGAMFGYLKNTDVGTTSANMTVVVNNATVGGHRFVGGVAGYFDGNGRIIRNASLVSGTFGTQGISGDVGGIAGYVSAGARVENATASQSSDSNFVTVNGVYRNISSIDIDNNNVEMYLYNNADGEVQNARGASSVGGFVGRLDGTLDGAEIGGAMQIFGSVAGGMIGFNRGTARNLKITDAARITFDLRYGGVYGGMVGYNSGLVSHAVIGRLNKFQGLSEDMGRLVNYQSDIVKDANIIFKTEGSASVIQGSGASSIYSPASGKLFDDWGGLAMGGVVGYNLSKVYNSVTYGKVVHYKKVNSGPSISDALGGVVGMDRGDAAEVRACGASYGMVISYTVINVSNSMSGSHSAAVGGVVGNHAGGIAVALFSFHTAVSSFTNAGIPGDSGYIPAVLRVSVGVGGVVAGIPGMATARSYISWAYYNEKSYDGSNFGPFMLGSSNAVQSSTFLRTATDVDGQNTGSSGIYNNRFNVFPTNYNYDTYVNPNNGYVFNVKAKAATLGDFRLAAAEDVTRAGYRVRDYFDAYAKVYAVNDEGRPTSTLVPWQYDSDNN